MACHDLSTRSPDPTRSERREPSDTASAGQRSTPTRIAPRGVLRRREGTCFSSSNDDEVGALPWRAPSGASGSERSNQTQLSAISGAPPSQERGSRVRLSGLQTGNLSGV